MASAAREYRYAHREFSTNGSLARDLDWAVRERELEHAGEVPRHERTQAAPKVYHKEQVLVRERQAIPVLSVLGVTAVAVAAAAGMAKPTSSQITYLDLDSEDSAVVYRTETPSVFSRILSSLHHGVYAVVEYFD